MKAAADARSDRDLLIVARTDAIATDGFDGRDRARRRLSRGRRGRDLRRGARATIDEIAEIRAGCRGRRSSTSCSAAARRNCRSKLKELGYAGVLYANVALQAALEGMQVALGVLRRDGLSVRPPASSLDFSERRRLVHEDPFDALERRSVTPAWTTQANRALNYGVERAHASLDRRRRPHRASRWRPSWAGAAFPAALIGDQRRHRTDPKVTWFGPTLHRFLSHSGIAARCATSTLSQRLSAMTQSMSRLRRLRLGHERFPGCAGDVPARQSPRSASACRRTCSTPIACSTSWQTLALCGSARAPTSRRFREAAIVSVAQVRDAATTRPMTSRQAISCAPTAAPTWVAARRHHHERQSGAGLRRPT